jgi:hypothetical protein
MHACAKKHCYTDALRFRDRIPLTMGIATYESVGCIPGNIQSISSECVKHTTISSTTRSAPIVRDTSRTLKSSTRLGMGKLLVELLELLSSGAALHRWQNANMGTVLCHALHYTNTATIWNIVFVFGAPKALRNEFQIHLFLEPPSDACQSSAPR